MSYTTNSTQRTVEAQAEKAVSSGFAFWDMMLQMQKASQQALSSFVPLAANGAPALGARFDERANGQAAQRTTNSVEVIPVGEESFHVGTRTVQGETTRLRRIVVETPVEQQVSLRTETVIVERRKPASTVPTTGDILTEKSVEMTDSFEVVETWKSVHLLEEIVLRTEVTEHTETVRDTVRRDEVKVEQPNHTARREFEAPKRDKAPAVQAVAKQIEDNIKTARPAAEFRLQDAVPPAAVKAEADRHAPARPTPEANPQDRKHAAPPHAETKQAASPVTASEHDNKHDNKPGAAPRADAGQHDKTPAAPARRA